jgi:lipid-binding SYLF domain-containing protein
VCFSLRFLTLNLSLVISPVCYFLVVHIFLVAIGLTGIGWGFILGASLKDIVYLIYDDFTLNAMAGDIGFKLGTQTEAALGTWGRTAEATLNISNKGVGSNIALSYSKGIFGGLSIEVSSLRQAIL